MSPSDTQKAAGYLREACRVHEEIGARPERARSYVSSARFFAATGVRERARDYLTRAIDMFQEMDMAWDLPRAEAALGDL